VTALVVGAFAEAARIEQGHGEMPGQLWLFSWRNAVLAMVPFALAGAWAIGLAALALYAATSFFIVQHWHHQITPD
jgi:hypothetical protein